MGHLLDVALSVTTYQQCCTLNVCNNPIKTGKPTDEINEITNKGYSPTWTPTPIEVRFPVEIPWQVCHNVDPLHSGKLTGHVPRCWTARGWVMSLKDRLRRTDDAETVARLKSELKAIEDQKLGTPTGRSGHTGRRTLSVNCSGKIGGARARRLAVSSSVVTSYHSSYVAPKNRTGRSECGFV